MSESTPRSRRVGTSARAAALAAAVLCCAGCATGGGGRAEGTAGPLDLPVMARYRGVYRDGAHPPRRFVLAVEVSGRDRFLLEIRGRVGGAGLVAARDGEGVVLVLVRERKVVRGCDAPEFWKRWTGLPISGDLVLSAVGPDASRGRRRVGAWTARYRFAGAGGRLPQRIVARRGAETIELDKTRERPVRERTDLRLPASFETIADPCDRSGDAPRAD